MRKKVNLFLVRSLSYGLEQKTNPDIDKDLIFCHVNSQFFKCGYLNSLSFPRLIDSASFVYDKFSFVCGSVSKLYSLFLVYLFTLDLYYSLKLL